MAFMQIAAPQRAQNEPVLTAVKTRPSHAEVMAILRVAGPALGMKPPVLATLEALLSCLPRERNHDVVFASNATIAMRRNGISDRTLRRHAAELIDLGLIARRDSPNAKRFVKRDQSLGLVLRFAFDLTPLFLSIGGLKSLAASCQEEERRISYLRMKLRISIMKSIELGAPEPVITAARTALRRKLTADKLEDWISRLAPIDHLEAAEEHHHDTSNSEDERPISTSHIPFQGKYFTRKEPHPIPQATRLDATSAAPTSAKFMQPNPREERDLKEKSELLLALRTSYELLEKSGSRPTKRQSDNPETCLGEAPSYTHGLPTSSTDQADTVAQSRTEDSPSSSKKSCESHRDDRPAPKHTIRDAYRTANRDPIHAVSPVPPEPVLTAVKRIPEATPYRIKAAYGTSESARASIPSASDGHSVRHHQNPNKESSKSLERRLATRSHTKRELTIGRILTNCKAATSLLAEKPRRAEDIITHARSLASMIGIERTAYDAAERSKGRFATALTVWFLTEIQDRIERTGAYFHSITNGSSARNFCPVEAILGLGSGAHEPLL